MSFIVVAKFRAKPESATKLKELITETAKQSWQEPGLLKYILVEDPNQPDLFTLVEFFETEADFNEHRQTAHLINFRDQVAELLASAPEVVRGVATLAQLDPKARIN